MILRYTPQATQVSTHSRAKAAGWLGLVRQQTIKRFNTQPREGGWLDSPEISFDNLPFQHTAARRRLAKFLNNLIQAQSFNTQPREGGWKLGFDVDPNFNYVSTHSRAKAAGVMGELYFRLIMFQHTAARRRLAQVLA